MTPKAWLIAIALALACLVGAYCYGERAGKIAQQDAIAKQQEQSIKDTIRVRDSVFVHDTVKLTVVRHRTDSLLRVDTLFRADTVRQIVTAERAACDSVIRACVAKGVALESLTVNLHQQIQLLQKAHPGFLGSLPGKMLWAGVGFLAGRALR